MGPEARTGEESGLLDGQDIDKLDLGILGEQLGPNLGRASGISPRRCALRASSLSNVSKMP